VQIAGEAQGLFTRSEFGGEGGFVGAVADEFTVGAGAEGEEEAAYNDRFSGAGFPGENSKPRSEIDIDMVDQGIVLDGQFR